MNKAYYTPVCIGTGYYGGKNRLAGRFSLMFPQHDIYIEPFSGSGVVLLNKRRAKEEILCDKDIGVCCLLETIRDNPIQLIEELNSFPCSEEGFCKARDIVKAGEQGIERAAAEYVLLVLSFNCTRKFFSASRKNMVTEYVYGNINMASRRLQGVKINNEDGIDLVKHYVNIPNAMIYLDPPYRGELRAKGATDEYRYELDKQQHIQLLDVIRNAEAKVLLSGYRSENTLDLYDRELSVCNKWHCYLLEISHKASSGKANCNAKEYIWNNYDLKSIPGAMGMMSGRDYLQDVRKRMLMGEYSRNRDS